MFKNIYENFKNLEKKIKIIMKNGLLFCFLLCILSLIILVIYNVYYTIPFVFTVGFIMFKLSLIFGVEFIICGFAVDKIKKQIV